MKIVLTDAQTVTNGDITLDFLKKYADALCIYPLSDRAETIERIADADAVIINKTVLDADVLSHAKNLRYIGIFATGYNMIDLDYCRAHGITVCNAGSYSTDAVAQTVFAFLLNRCNRVAEYHAFVENGGWIASPSFSPFVFPTMELAGKTLGIFGFGTIGKKVADIAKAFSMRVIAVPHKPTQPPYDGVTYAGFDTMLANADFITCHCPLNAETKEIFNADAFAKCKDGAYFINTARGGIVSEPALRDALESGKLSGAAVDVLTAEPMRADCVLYHAKNLVFTPHVAWAPYETRIRLMGIVEENLKNYLAGAPTHVVS